MAIDFDNQFEVNGNTIAVKDALDLVIQAGNLCMQRYNSRHFTIADKGGNVRYPECAPRQLVTEADKEVQAFLEKSLNTLTPDIPFLGEEGKKNLTRLTGSQWQCDPVDGTRFFVGKDELVLTGEENLEGQFTIHLALIKDDTPVFGIVYAPAYGELYFNDTANSAVFVKFNNKDNSEKRVMPKVGKDKVFVLDNKNNINLLTTSGNKVKVSLKLLERIFSFGKDLSDGSMLKAMGVAAGQKSYTLNKRFGFYEWDTSAAQAILAAVGGNIFKSSINLRTGEIVDTKLTTGHKTAVNYHNDGVFPLYSGGVFHTQPSEPINFLTVSKGKDR